MAAADGSEQRTPRSLFWGCAAFYALLALLLTSPRLLGTGAYVTDDWHDNEIFFWNFWWLKEALATGQNPWYTTLLFHPEGTTLGFHPTAFLYAAISLPFQLLLGSERGVILAYNGITLASLTLAALFTFVLARRLTGSNFAAFIAGCLYGFSAFHFWHLGRLHVGGLEWIALYALALHRWLDAGRRRIAAGLLVGAAAVALLYTSLTHLLSAAMLTILLLGVHLWRHPRRRTDLDLWKGAAAAAGVVLLAVLPFVYAWMTHPAPLQASRSLQENVEWSADPAGFVVPGSTHRVYRAIPALARAGDGLGGREIFAGFLTLTALPFVFRRPRPDWLLPWSVVALTFFVLSLGPELKFFGLATGIPGPYRLLIDWLPPFRVNRTPIRYDAILQLALALMAAGGIAALRRRWPGKGPAAALLAFALVDVAHSARTIDRRPAAAPFESLAALPADRVVLNVPLYHALLERRIMAEQILHRRPLTTACIPRASAPQHGLISGTLLRACLMDAAACARSDPGVVRQEIEKRKIGAIVLHHRPLPADLRRAIELLLSRTRPRRRLDDPSGLTVFLY